MADNPTTPPPAYFLSLSLENVRSFGAKQTISFAREDGRPAQWTIILGDNGVGKTTVLKALAAGLETAYYKATHTHRKEIIHQCYQAFLARGGFLTRNGADQMNGDGTAILKV